MTISHVNLSIHFPVVSSLLIYGQCTVERVDRLRCVDGVCRVLDEWLRLLLQILYFLLH